VNACGKESKYVLKKVIRGYKRWVYEIASVKIIKILVGNIDGTNLLLSFVKPFGLTSGTSVRGMVGLILVRKGFNYFNFL